MQKETDFKNKLKDLFKVFTRLGFITFGGPAVHIAMFEDEVVSKRKWMDHQHFLDLVGATNLIPGPNSTEMALHTGYHRAGIIGLIIAGISFTLPAVMIAGILAYIYSLYGNLPNVQPFLYGIKPAVIVIVLNAVYKLGAKAVKGWKLLLIATVVFAASFLGLNEVFSILLGGILGALFIHLSEKKNLFNTLPSVVLLPFILLNTGMQVVDKIEPTLTKIFFSCLKIGAVWFGGGYVLVAYFNGEFVQGLNWLTRQELLDAIAVGQFTPGPFLSSATFIGYQIAGINGAIAATVGILIPSFVFVLLLNPLVPRLRKSKLFSVFLDAVNVSAIAVMLVVTLKLGFEIIISTNDGVNWSSIIIASLGIVAFLTIKNINTAYLVIGGAVVGYILHLI